MEGQYNITVTNKFELPYNEDADPHDILAENEQVKEAKKREKLSEKENKSKQPEAQKTPGNKPQKNRVIKDAQQQASKVQDNKKEQVDKKLSQPRSGGGDRNVKFSGESREERNNRRNREDSERAPRGQGDLRRGTSGEVRETREFRNSNENRGEYGERRGRGGMRGMGRGRGGSRGGRGGFDNRGKREFDRQSGSDKTGIKPVDKKDGAGSHNWGTHNDEIEESLNQENQDWANEKPDADTSQAANETKEGETPTDALTEEKPAEEESRELTLDQWKALRNNRTKPQYNLRKAGEGEDPTRWKKMYVLERKNNEEEEEEVEYDAAEYPQRAGRQKPVLGIEIQFSDSRRGSGGRGRGGRGGRGERGGGRGFGNRGGGSRDAGGEPRSAMAPPQAEQRSPRSRQNAPKVDDENDFPSLG